MCDRQPLFSVYTIGVEDCHLELVEEYLLIPLETLPGGQVRSSLLVSQLHTFHAIIVFNNSHGLHDDLASQVNLTSVDHL